MMQLFAEEVMPHFREDAEIDETAGGRPIDGRRVALAALMVLAVAGLAARQRAKTSSKRVINRNTGSRT